MEDLDGKDADNEEEEIEIEDEELELDCERAQKREDPTEDFVTGSEIQAITKNELESRHPTILLLSSKR